MSATRPTTVRITTTEFVHTSPFLGLPGLLFGFWYLVTSSPILSCPRRGVLLRQLEHSRCKLGRPHTRQGWRRLFIGGPLSAYLRHCAIGAQRTRCASITHANNRVPGTDVAPAVVALTSAKRRCPVIAPYSIVRIVCQLLTPSSSNSASANCTTNSLPLMRLRHNRTSSRVPLAM